MILKINNKPPYRTNQIVVFTIIWNIILSKLIAKYQTMVADKNPNKVVTIKDLNTFKDSKLSTLLLK